ncbi:MAG: magnesium transporter [Bacillota bacterium]
MPKLSLLGYQKRRELTRFIQKGKSDSALQTRLRKVHPYDIGEALLKLDDEQRARVLSLISIAKLSDTFEQLEKEHTAECLPLLDDDRAKSVLEAMEIDEVSELLTYYDDDDQTRYLNLMRPQRRERVKRQLGYEIMSAGSQMNARYITLHRTMGVKNAMKILVNRADQVEIIDTLFVVDDENRLEGVVDLKDLIVAKPPTTIAEIMYTNYYAAHVDDPIQEVIPQIQRYDAPATPVVDSNHHLEGILTLDDVMDAIEEESHDDYAKLAGITTEDRIYDTARKTAWSRLPWLAVMLGLNLIVTTVLSGFEETIAAITALVLFQPLILGMAGNIGTQSLAVTILKLSKESFPRLSSVFRHMTQEVGIGIINGIILGFLGFTTATIFLMVSPMGVVEEGLIQPTEIGLVVGLSIALALTVSTMLGSMIPLILDKLKVDPAVASGPFITTLNDITALVVYFGLASALIMTVL